LIKLQYLRDFCEKSFGSPTTRTLGDISKQNRAAHLDEGGNIINRFRRSNSTISCKLLSFDAGVDEISMKNETLEAYWGSAPAILAQPVNTEVV
jgi:hypothetical protein